MAEALVEQTKEYLRRHQGSADVISADVIQAVIELMQQKSEQQAVAGEESADQTMGVVVDDTEPIEVYNVLTDMKPFDYHRANKEWRASPIKPSIFAGVGMKGKIYTDRYHLLWQRLLLDNKLVPEAEAAITGLLPGQRVLTPVESLVGNPGKKLTFGLLSRALDGDGVRQWVLEDLHKIYPLELEITQSSHLLTDGSFVLAEGELCGDGQTFRISNLEVPPCVTRKMSVEKDQVPVQVFGGSLTEEQLQLRKQREDGNAEEMFVVLSEVHLDSARCLEKLSDLFGGYESAGAPPAAYVFMGSFTSAEFVPTAEGVKAYREGFERLKFILQRLTQHVQRGTRFIFVPGPMDPGARTLPRTPLTGYLTADLAKEIPGVTMATNPCRIRHFTRELVFFRHDVLRLLRRHEAVPLREAGTSLALSPQRAREEMVRFLLDQAHLVPLPLQESNILWAFDHTLRLYPLPSAVFIGGISQPFESSYQECNFASVGPFHRDATFHAYYPIQEVLEPCDVPDMA